MNRLYADTTDLYNNSRQLMDRTMQTNQFSNAPPGWTVESALAIAEKEDLEMTQDHWELIAALHEYYSKASRPVLRQIKDALDERFHTRGGMKYLYEICPGGPVAQGCRLAGLEVPPGAIDKSFGSVA